MTVGDICPGIWTWDLPKPRLGKSMFWPDWNAAWPVPLSGGPNPLLERIVTDPVLLERYRRAARVILDKYFEPKRLCGIIDAKYALIKDDLEADPFPHRRATVPSDRSYDDVVASMKDFVRKRHASALKQLQKPGERPKAVRRPRGGRPEGFPPGFPPQLAAKIQRMQQRVQQMQKKRSGHRADSQADAKHRSAASTRQAC